MNEVNETLNHYLSISHAYKKRLIRAHLFFWLCIILTFWYISNVELNSPIAWWPSVLIFGSLLNLWWIQDKDSE